MKGYSVVLVLLSLYCVTADGLTITHEKTTSYKGYLYRYVVSNLFDSKSWVLFDEAETECKKWGGNLASIHSTAERSFLKSLVTRNALTYIGHDVNKWTDGTPIDYQQWKAQLGVLRFKTNPSEQRTQPAFICKKRDGGLTITHEKTTSYKGYLYRYVVSNLFDSKSWVLFDEAETECKKWGGNLASIHSTAERSLLKSLATRNALTYIGHDINKWTDGTPIDYQQWKAQLGVLRFKTHPSDQRTQPAFICKKGTGSPQVTIAYEKTVDYNGYKYRYVVTPTHTAVHWVDFYRSERECVKWGGHLTSIHSQRELDFIKGLVTKNALTYIGHDINKWTDGTPNDFTCWKTKLAPRLAYKSGSSHSKQPAFICKKKMMSNVVISYEKTSTYNGRTYRYVVTPTSDPKKWVDFYTAEKDCKTWGGHLTSIHSDQEFNFIKSLVTRNALTYIGFDVTRWTDGTPVDYSGWKKPGSKLVYRFRSASVKQPSFICRK